jgi:probable phosphoglycerate mutase
VTETRLVLVRHGETEWSRDSRHTGRTDIPLTAVGRRQAERLGIALRGRTFTQIRSSPLSRALDTCHLAGFADRVVADDDLREWDYGAYEGRTSAEIREEVPGWSIWTGDVPGGESIADVAARADRVIARLLPVGGDVLLFAHGHLLRVLGSRWIEQPPTTGGRLELGTASISELGWEHDRRVIERWNEGHHLDA